jgi:ribosomal protein S18 acetylase RimI-like enzyme
MRLRAARDADRDWASRVYLATTKPYVDHLPEWTDAFILGRFIDRFDVAASRVIEIDRAAAGWLRLSENDGEIVLEQVYLAPEHHGRGIGTALLRGLVADWQAQGKPVLLRVLKRNPARRLYERFGFRRVGETDIQYLMRRDPA